MANVKNATTTAPVGNLKSALLRVKVKLSPEATKVIDDLNNTAANLSEIAFSTRTITYAFVASLVDASHLLMAGGEEAFGFTSLFKALNLPEPDPEQETANQYLPLVRAADGEWKTTEKDGKKTTKWAPNRSSEKHAQVCRFAVTNGYTGQALLDFLNGTEELKIVHDGKEWTVKPTLSDIMRFDSKVQFPQPDRKVLKKDDWEEINQLQPIVKFPFTEQFKAAFTIREGAIGSAVWMIRDGEVWLVGDEGRKGNELQRILKGSRKDFHEKRAIAHTKPETVAEVPVEVLISDEELGDE